MIYSRNKTDLRNDLIPWVDAGFDELKKRGWKPGCLTYRDQEYQTSLNLKGLAPALVTFHGVAISGKPAALAFDVFNNVKDNEYPAAFMKDAAEIFERMGFTWGGRWKKPDGPHFQWDGHGKWTGKMVRAGDLPPPMPIYKPAAVPIPTAVLRIGSKGADVVKLQERLKSLGFYKANVDADFGPVTLSAVKAFQAARKLDADGVVGTMTWKALYV